VYLVHLAERMGSTHPRGGCQHYIGWTGVGVDRRLAVHREGRGSRMLAAAVERGISFNVVKTWDGGRDLERQLKNRRNAPKLCPTCAGMSS
jgi:hypothetical protein